MKKSLSAALAALALTTAAFANDSTIGNLHIGASDLSLAESSQTSIDVGLQFNWEMGSNIYLGFKGDMSFYTPQGNGTFNDTTVLMTVLPSLGYKIGDVMLNADVGYALGTIGDAATLSGMVYGAHAEYYIAQEYPIGVGYQTGTLTMSTAYVDLDQDYSRAYVYIGKRF